MTEKEWLTCSVAVWMFEVLKEKVRRRNLALFAVACCRKDRWLMEDPRSRHAIEWTERLIDGLVDDDDADAPLDGDCYLMSSAANHCMAVAGQAKAGNKESALEFAYDVIESLCGSIPEEEEESANQQLYADLLRDIFGNPFRPVAFDPAWRTSTVTAVAQTIYDKRRFTDMPILADALEEAGCTAQELLDHCRNPGEHVRGCWVVDLVLAKE